MTADEALDRVALADLVMRYCRGVDRRDFALVRSLYWDDAVDHHGAMFDGTADAFVAWLPDAMAPFELTVHRVTNSLFAIDGDRAEGEHYAVAYHRTRPPQRREIVIGGRYLDRYERRAGTWKFIERSLVFDHGDARPVDETAFEELSGQAPGGTADRSDPSWTLGLLAGPGA
ncbi:nuclear transport factor 2 family protein [Altererythrobacter aerius]|uniref:Nuclear transport factor 2 family protein n=1 Tax=Tsuneonella aeria TaxID=1837929 RepID=A0A6I4TC83_9SPHN|nr:nuclear transport factor 2 family protein [Tsuneonella aeria]